LRDKRELTAAGEGLIEETAACFDEMSFCLFS
jgi:hypothetical protein